MRGRGPRRCSFPPVYLPQWPRPPLPGTSPAAETPDRQSGKSGEKDRIGKDKDNNGGSRPRQPGARLPRERERSEIFHKKLWDELHKERRRREEAGLEEDEPEETHWDKGT
jgi:hypothetical protein